MTPAPYTPSSVSSFVRQSWRLLVVAIASGGIGITMSVVSPYLVGAYIANRSQGGLALGESTAGALASFEMVATALAAIISASLVTRFRLSCLLIGAGGAIILVNAVSFYGDMSSLWFLRPIAGAAAGIAVGVANAIIARSIDPDRLYGLSSTLGTAMSAFALLLTPYFTAWLGYSGVFLLLGVSAVMLTPIALLLPTHVDLLPPQAKLASPNFLSTSGLFVVATAVLLNLGDGSLYSFSELIGERSGLDKTEIGEVLAIAGLFGVLGALLAATLGSRLGRLAPFAVAVTLKAVGSLVVTTMISPSAFVAMQFLLTCTFYFSIVFLLGLSASIDPRGGLPAMTGGFILLGGSVGPVFGGAVVEHFGYPWFGIGVALCLAAAFACFVIADRLNRAVLVEKI